MTDDQAAGDTYDVRRGYSRGQTWPKGSRPTTVAYDQLGRVSSTTHGEFTLQVEDD